ncbi:hypothetical protein [Alicyclobacillus shizuokensis]|uniref:hypothetical protein n=1 Tax=Alicyclobacillus shizuokensis TaxID=392014 RepID=UPI00082EBD4A|nr:hypothetical protein [Alicyclobacillus shizuokensis]
MNPKELIWYDKGDTVIVIDPLSPYDGWIGTIEVANPKKMRYLVAFEHKRVKDTFWYNQIRPYRSKEDLLAMIDLALALGPAAEWMFHDWVIELHTRFPETRGN